MGSSPFFPSSSEYEAAEALLLLSNHQPFIWSSKKKRSIRYRSKSVSKVTVKEETEEKIVPETLSPSTPLSFHTICEDPPRPLLEFRPESASEKRHGEILKEQKEKIAVLVQDNLDLRKVKEDLVLNEQRMILMAQERTQRWRAVFAAARKRRKGLMREKKAGIKSDRSRKLGEGDGGVRWRERYGATRKRRMEFMREKKIEKKRQRLG